MEEYTQIALDEWTSWKEDIRRKLAETAGNFVYIGYRLKQIRDSGMLEGAVDIFEFAQKEYGLEKSTVSRFIAINERYSEGGNSLELKEEYKAYSSSKLAEMLTLPDTEIELITEKTTIREIRELKNFNKQKPDPEHTVETTWSALDKCLIDFFEQRREILNKVMECMDADPPRYKEAAEIMAPSGQASHKKGILFLFMYDWNTGIKYKLMTQPEPISMSWQELLNEVYGIYALCSTEDVWADFYKQEKVEAPQSNQGFAPSVATSQQAEKDTEENTLKAEQNEVIIEENETENTENVSRIEENESEIMESVSKIEENESEIMENVSEEAEESEEAAGLIEKTDETASCFLGVDGHGSEETGVCETASERSTEAAVDNAVKAGKYDQTISELIENLAYKSNRIAEELKGKEQKKLTEYRKIKAAVNNLSADIEQVMKFIDLAEDKEAEEEES